MPLEVKIAPTYTKEGLKKSTNMPGYYRKCEDENCPRLIPCPYVKCQDHRTDMADIDWKVPHFEPEEVIIQN